MGSSQSTRKQGAKVDHHFLRPWRRVRPSRNAIFEVPLIGGGGEVAVFISRTIRPSRNATSVQSPFGTPSCRSFFSRTVLSAFAFASCSVVAASSTTAPSEKAPRTLSDRQLLREARREARRIDAFELTVEEFKRAARAGSVGCQGCPDQILDRVVRPLATIN
jgi:hypothetical protein